MTVLKRAAGEVIAAWAMAALTAIAPLTLLGFGLVLAVRAEGAGLVLVLFAAPLVFLAVLVVNEARARAHTRVIIDDHELALRLPARRGYILQPRVDEAIPLSAIAAIETRLEAFHSLGVTAAQRVFVLALKDGRRLVLGADRPMIGPFFEAAASAIGAQTRLTVRDRGVVDANPGFLLLAGASAPPWEIPGLAPAAAHKRVTRASRSIRFVMAFASLALVIAATARSCSG